MAVKLIDRLHQVTRCTLNSGLEVDSALKARTNRYRYLPQKAKTKETKSKNIRNKKQRLVIDAKMQTKIFILFFIRMH